MSNFYQQLPCIDHISEVTQPANYRPVPSDWVIALSDVRNSTAAITQGRYHDVNALSAATIAALLNLAQETQIPFVFGGDGVSVLLPPTLAAPAREALLGTQRIAQQAFKLELRVGIVPVAAVLAVGHQVQVAKLRMNEQFQQAVFIGGGLRYAEEQLKRPDSPYTLSASGVEHQADFSGFECRWNAIPSPSEEILTLIITATHAQRPDQYQIYAEVLAEIERIYGPAGERHPLSLRQMQLSLNPLDLRREALLRFGGLHPRRLFSMWKGSALARLAMRFKLRGWGRYRQIVAATTDHEKFDDTLRMIIAGTQAQRYALLHYLEAHYQKGALLYGAQVSQHALMTCIVYDHFGWQVHFVDGAEGGYALAAQQLKQRQQLRRTREMAAIGQEVGPAGFEPATDRL